MAAMEQVSESSHPLASFRRVWRQEGWLGVARRIRARLWWLGLEPSASRLRPPEAPTMIEIGETPLEGFARSISLPMVADPAVSVIVPVLDQVEHTLCCLASMGRHRPATPFEVVLVDDGSRDDASRLLRSVPNLVLVRNETTLGFVRSVNRGAAAARGRLLLLLNNDTQVRPGWLDGLVAAFEDPEVGIAGSKLIYPSGHLQEAGAVLRSDGTVELVGLNDNPHRPQYNVSREVDHCSGASLMIPRDLFLDLGGLDEAYAPAYFEDCDLALRVRQAGRKVVYAPASTVVHHLSLTTSAVGVKNQQIETNRQRLLDTWSDLIAHRERVRVLAFYLPQYHPIPENDAWWGPGFTEWTNVVRARPLFHGHRQPRLPADLGFYDLRLPEVRGAQADLAARHGLSGFCYYYYWFGGKRLLERPLLDVLEQGKPGFPFCVCWANENWTRRWDGHDDEILIGQRHSPQDDRRFLESLLPFFEDERYVRVDGRPLLLLYRPQLLPDVARTTAIWREVALGAGVGELYVGAVQSFDAAWDADPRPWGFDAAVEFPPHGLAAPRRRPFGSSRRSRFFDYAMSAERFVARPVPDYPLFRTVMPSWDNTPRRRERAHVFLDGSPEVYERWLEAVVRQTRHLRFGDERIVFINAWNEWAEGNTLEPDVDNGHAYLEATARALGVPSP